MRISDMVSMCLGNLFRRKMRTILTIIGVIVGTCAIVVMISLGLGMNLSQEAMLAQMGDLTIISVYNWNNSNKDLVMDDAMVATIQGFAGVDVATPIYYPNFQARIYSGKKDRYRMEVWNIMGMYTSAMSKMGYQLIEGEYPDGPSELKNKPIKALAGEYTAYEFTDYKKKYNATVWPDEDPVTGKIKEPFVDILNDTLTFRTIDPEADEDEKDDPDPKAVTREIKVTGRVKEDWNKGYETSRGLFMDINDLKKLEEEYNKAYKIKTNTSSGQKKGYDRVTVKVNSMEDVEPVEEQIQALGFETNSMESIRKPMQEQARQQQMFLGGLGGISLLVAAIGITNTMIMSIYERTREIGVMKVLGCKVKNIRTVFLMEAGVIGFVGGCIGIGISYGISFLMNYFNFSFSGNSGMGMGYGYYMGGAGETIPVSVIPLWLVVAAIVFATLIGLVSGIAPANRAMKISALEAIKHE